MSAEEYALACAHDPRAKLRLYGCSSVVDSGVLLIVDGTVVLAGNAVSQRAVSDSALQALRGRVIDSVRYFPADSATRLFGSRARSGAVLFWTRPTEQRP